LVVFVAGMPLSVGPWQQDGAAASDLRRPEDHTWANPNVPIERVSSRQLLEAIGGHCRRHVRKSKPRSNLLTGIRR
jgi:hypothetical protein